MRKMRFFRRNKKVSTKLLKFGFNVRLDLNKKTSTHTWWFHQKQRCYRHFNATKYVFQCRHCNRTSDRYEPYAHQCCACDSRNYHRVIIRIFTLRSTEVLHGKFMWGTIIISIPGSSKKNLGVSISYVHGRKKTVKSKTMLFCALLASSWKLFAKQMPLPHDFSLGQVMQKCVLCHMRTTKAQISSLISTFVVRCLGSMICILAISKVSRF